MKLMKQAQKAQRQMEAIQAELAGKTVEGTSGGGAVKVVANCEGALVSVKIDPDAISPEDVQMLEDMILTAANQAISEAKNIYNAEMAKVTSGMGLPGMM
jgi:DNA-binding YbaB/EbfC family protein